MQVKGCYEQKQAWYSSSLGGIAMENVGILQEQHRYCWGHLRSTNLYLLEEEVELEKKPLKYAQICIFWKRKWR